MALVMQLRIGYIEFMTSIGFVAGMSTPCIFCNKDMNLRAVVHGDDFTIMGYDRNLDGFRSKIKERFEVKIKR